MHIARAAKAVNCNVKNRSSVGVDVRVFRRHLRNPIARLLALRRDMESSTATEATEAELAFQRAEFLAEDELIEINPMVKSDVITLVRGEFGPFEPSVTTSVSWP